MINPKMIAAAGLVGLGLIAAGGYAIKYSINKAAEATSAAQIAIEANATTAGTLKKTAEATAKMVELTEGLSGDIGALSRNTTTGLRALQGSLKNAKQVDLDSRVPRDVVVPICVQWVKASGHKSGVAGKAIPGAPVSSPADAIAEQCARAWERVTWRDLVEYIMPIMQHGGELRLQLKAGGEYYMGQEAK